MGGGWGERNGAGWREGEGGGGWGARKARGRARGGGKEGRGREEKDDFREENSPTPKGVRDEMMTVAVITRTTPLLQDASVPVAHMVVVVA